MSVFFLLSFVPSSGFGRTFVDMRDQGIWSIGLGTWNGVRARLHMFFLLFAAFTIYLGLVYDKAVWTAPALVAILFASVILHEIGHVMVARRLGGRVDEVELGPLGGLSSIPISADPQSELVSVVAGPLMNLAICFLSALGLAAQKNVDLIALMHPLSPGNVMGGPTYVVVLKMIFWVNWTLILVNLIPAFPFDGGRALKAGILSFRSDMDSHAAVMIVARVAKLTALGLLVIAWLVRNEFPNAIIDTWFALVLLAIFVFFSARKAEVSEEATSDEAFFGYDFSQGYTSLENSTPSCSTKAHAGLIVGWFENRRKLKEQVRRQSDAEEDGRVDEILTQVHQQGMGSLSAEDRAILDRASHRYRNRLH